MGAGKSPDLDGLIGQASRGDAQARMELLSRYRDRLRQMVATRLDRRLAPCLDPSDVVEKAPAVANLRLDDYFRDRPVSSYPWLWQIAWKLIRCQEMKSGVREEIRCQCTVVSREKLNRHRGTPDFL